MPRSIRGHQGRFELYENGERIVIDTITNVQITQDSSMSKHFYVGQTVPETDQTIEGWSGSLTLEVKNDVIERFIDALITNNLNGIGVSDYSFISTEYYSDGTLASYVYGDCAFSLSKTQGGLNEKITKTLNIQASFRQRI